jgi:hypothetical protein
MRLTLLHYPRTIAGILLTGGLALVVSACSSSTASTGISPQVMADSLHAVMAADRTVYTKKVVNRLVKEDKVIKASEHWEDDKALPLPAQMFRFGAELVAEKGAPFSYSLLSLWPINKKKKKKTDAEKEGLQYIADNPGQNFYKEEELGGVKYFTAVYPDPAVAPACVDCHNDHKDTPKSDFKIGDIMGGVVIRIPLQG